MKGKIYDCFIFNNELDILDIRLNVMDSIVDKFVLVESTVTHTNVPKELHYSLNKKLFKKFEKKIIHIVVRDTPSVSNPWLINDYQFSQISRGLVDCDPEDLILFGDMDEIPRTEKVLEFADKPGKLKVFMQAICQYYLNFVVKEDGTWPGTRMIRAKNLTNFATLWVAKHSDQIDLKIINGGWHFSHMGGIKSIRKKMSSSIHQEFNNDRYNTPERIKKAILNGTDVINMGYKFHQTSLDFLPPYVSDNKTRFKKMLLQQNKESNLQRKIVSGYLDLVHLLRIHILRKVRKILISK